MQDREGWPAPVTANLDQGQRRDGRGGLRLGGGSTEGGSAIETDGGGYPIDGQYPPDAGMG